MPYEVGVDQPHVIGDPLERDTLKAQAAGHGSRFTAPPASQATCFHVR